MSNQHLSHCRSCGAPILYLRMAAGKALAVDAEPSAGGNIAVGDNGTGELVSKGAAARSTGLHFSHQTTCPHGVYRRHRRCRDLFADRGNYE